MHCNFFRFLCKFCKDGLLPLCGSKIHFRFQIAHEFYIRLCIAARTGRTARRVTIFECKHRQGARRVVSAALPARGSGGGALPLAGAASPLTCPPGAANPSSPALRATPGGLRSLRSASSLSFLVTCRRQVIPSHAFAVLTALAVRRVKGDVALLVRRVSGNAARLPWRAELNSALPPLRAPHSKVPNWPFL